MREAITIILIMFSIFSSKTLFGQITLDTTIRYDISLDSLDNYFLIDKNELPELRINRNDEEYYFYFQNDSTLLVRVYSKNEIVRLNYFNYSFANSRYLDVLDFHGEIIGVQQVIKLNLNKINFSYIRVTKKKGIIEIFDGDTLLERRKVKNKRFLKIKLSLASRYVLVNLASCRKIKRR